MTVRELMIALIECSPNKKVNVVEDYVHYDERDGYIQGYLFELDAVKEEYGVVALKFKDWRREE